jgi:hypothetical protein
LAAPRIPKFDKHRVDTAADGGIRIIYEPVEAAESEFQLISSVARRGKLGSFVFLFACTKGSPRASIEILPGRYLFSGSEPKLIIADEKMSISLSLRRAPAIRGLTTYGVSIERMMLFTAIILDPSASSSKKIIPLAHKLERSASP